jgi:large subunit ribosomal protein L1
MGKIRTRTIGLEDVEEKQKKEQKRKAVEKKISKKHLEAKIAAETKEKIDNEGNVKKLPSVKSTDVELKKKDTKKQAKEKARGKNYQKSKKLVDRTKIYSLIEAIELLKKMKYAKFDESVELHLNVDKSGLRGEVELPHSTGKNVRVKIVDDILLADLEKGKIEFDVLVTHPSFMPKLAKFAKVLGPKGLMPNPKAGTISPKPEEVVKKFAKGTMRFKTEAKFPLIHQMIGKVSFADKQLSENAQAFLLAVGKLHIKSAFVKTTMSPSVKIDIEKV